MVGWGIFRRKPQPQQTVTTGRLEIERSGEVAYLEYSLSGDVLALIHTEIPDKFRHQGLADSLAEAAFQWAREKKLRVDVTCPVVRHYLSKHPEHADLVMQ